MKTKEPETIVELILLIISGGVQLVLWIVGLYVAHHFIVKFW